MKSIGLALGLFGLGYLIAAVTAPAPLVSGPVRKESPGNEPSVLRVMSLNIYGWATMPDKAPEYAALIEAQNIDVLGIQEGNWDWEIEGWPTDYSRSEQLHAALGECWQRRYQIFVNTCRGATLDSHRRFDLMDGPRAVRTGETALVTKSGAQVAFINIHWDHESAPARAASAIETATEADLHRGTPTIVLGDFNCECASADVTTLRNRSDMALVVDGGIDCILARGISGSGTAFDATPSDHPAVVATFVIGNQPASPALPVVPFRPFPSLHWIDLKPRGGATREYREARGVPIQGPQLLDAVLDRQGGDVGVEAPSAPGKRPEQRDSQSEAWRDGGAPVVSSDAYEQRRDSLGDPLDRPHRHDGRQGHA